jgi:NADPH:quinone reductase-like Zn-dependent oxidoreductase
VPHVHDSRSTGFAAEILAATQGRGVDVVLNSLTGEGFIEASLTALAPGGRFVEIGKRGIWSAAAMAAARPDVAYHILAVDRLMAEDPARTGARRTQPPRPRWRCCVRVVCMSPWCWRTWRSRRRLTVCWPR